MYRPVAGRRNERLNERRDDRDYTSLEHHGCLDSVAALSPLLPLLAVVMV